MQKWKLIQGEDLKDGVPVVFVGVHVLRWRSEWGEPSVAFIDKEDHEPELLEALEKAVNALEDKLYDDAEETWASKDVAQKHAAALVQEYRELIAKAKAS